MKNRIEIGKIASDELDFIFPGFKPGFPPIPALQDPDRTRYIVSISGWAFNIASACPPAPNVPSKKTLR